jgi:hypothetical protein
MEARLPQEQSMQNWKASEFAAYYGAIQDVSIVELDPVANTIILDITTNQRLIHRFQAQCADLSAYDSTSLNWGDHNGQISMFMGSRQPGWWCIIL